VTKNDWSNFKEMKLMGNSGKRPESLEIKQKWGVVSVDNDCLMTYVKEVGEKGRAHLQQ